MRDLRSGTSRLRRRLAHDVARLVFAGDGERPAVVGSDGTIRVLDTAVGLPIAPPRRFEGPISDLVFSPDGAEIVVATTEGRLRRVALPNPAADEPTP